MITQEEKRELGLDIAKEGQWEVFYQKGDRHGEGRNSEMYNWHKQRRLELEAKYRLTIRAHGV